MSDRNILLIIGAAILVIVLSFVALVVIAEKSEKTGGAVEQCVATCASAKTRMLQWEVGSDAWGRTTTCVCAPNQDGGP
jgi:hypothetical protein